MSDIDIQDLIPHRPPFRFVDTMVSAGEDEGVFALELTIDDERCSAGTLAPLFLVEALAQSAAAYHGARNALADGPPESGQEPEQSQKA